MLIIGLTGGIASGKSAVADYFEKLGANVIDTDLIARDVVKPGEPALAKIQAHFGDDIIQSDGYLNRRKLRDIIFANTYTQSISSCDETYAKPSRALHKQRRSEPTYSPAEKRRVEREWLENLLHPLIRKRAHKALADQNKSPYHIVVIPLFFESIQPMKVDRIAVVDCTEEKQISRASKRDAALDSDIQAMLDSQVTRKKRVSMADDLIDNNGSLDELEAKVKALHKLYLQLV